MRSFTYAAGAPSSALHEAPSRPRVPGSARIRSSRTSLPTIKRSPYSSIALTPEYVIVIDAGADRFPRRSVPARHVTAFRPLVVPEAAAGDEIAAERTQSRHDIVEVAAEDVPRAPVEPGDSSCVP
jgi:hypothetical protein